MESRRQHNDQHSRCNKARTRIRRTHKREVADGIALEWPYVQANNGAIVSVKLDNPNRVIGRRTTVSIKWPGCRKFTESEYNLWAATEKVIADALDWEAEHGQD